MTEKYGAPSSAFDDLDALSELLEAAGIDAGVATGIRPRDPSAPVPMSFSQELLWLLDRATPGMTAYNLTTVRRLRGALNVNALEKAFHDVVSRHEVLRTHLADENGQALQIVGTPSANLLRLVDLSATDAAMREAAAERVVREHATAPFDLAGEHLFRPSLVKLSDDNHVLVIASHHIVLDGWSMSIVMRELSEAYAAAVAEREMTSAKPSIQFGDFAAWQREQLAGPRLAELLSFWRNQLGDATEPLALPTDFARSAHPTFAGARQAITLSATQLSAVKNLAAKNDATLYMVLLAAYATVLHRYTGRTDVLIGSGSAGRTLPETENVVGYLNNTLVQHANFANAPTFATVLQHVRDGALGAYDHQDIPLEKLALELRQGDARLAPLFEVVLTMQDTLGGTMTFGDVQVESFGIDFASTKFDITLLVSERSNELTLTAQYRSDLFAPSSMQRFLGHIVQVLDSVVANSAIQISEIPLLTAAERAELVEWNETSVKEGAPATIVSLIDAQVARVSDAVAVIADDATLTYAQLNTKANRLAQQLQSLGVSANTPVGLLLDRSANAIEGLLGILKAGGAYVPLSVEAPDARIGAQIAECGARVVVTDVAHAGKISGATIVIALDGAPDPAKLDALPATTPTNVVNPDDLAYVLYTSGSTGTPKGVAVTHKNAVHYARAVSRVLADVPTGTEGDGLAALSGLHFAIASTVAADLGNTSLLPSLMSGGTLHVLSKDVTTDSARYAEYARAHAIDILKITPNHLAALTGGKTGRDLADVLPKKWVIVGGEALRPEVARAFLSAHSCRLLNHYGPTETTVGVCTFEVTNASLEQAVKYGALTVPLGRPLANTHAYVVDASDNEMPVGIPGELLFGGDGVTQGYLRRDDLTAERFVQFNGERVYRTGDRARRLPDGTIEFLGRIDDQVKIRGHRVELGEVEHALRAHSGVAGAVVVMRDDAAGEPTLVAFAVARTGDYAVSHSDRPTPERLTEWLATRLPAHMLPSIVVMLDALPLTANGKIDRAKLPATVASTESQYVAPRNDIETQLVAIWTDVLKHENIGITDNFLALGGHSLMAIRVLGKISKAFSVRLPLRILFETPTIEALAVVIEKEKATSKPVTSTIGATSRDKYRVSQAPPAGTSSGDVS